jgi:hypothetical protein
MFPNPPHLTHVKAHQDDATSYDKLLAESQLNVQADTLAKNYNSSSSHATTTVPRLSCNAAQLHCQGQTVTFRYPRTVPQETLSPAIRQYIMERNHWTAADMETVHWEAHGQALEKNYVRRTFLVKLIHDKLPMGKTVARYKDSYDHRCPSCQDDQEDRTHFLRCPHPDCTKWHLTLTAAIRKRCEYIPTRPYLMEILLDGLHHWFHDTPFPKYTCLDHYHPLIDQQEQLGWQQLFLGRLRTLWSHHQNSHLRHSPTTDGKHSGTSWILSMALTIWMEVQLQ